ncbi:MerR family transcriptional regulator [Allosphingosinicella flava]|uniref:MerR family transcriptional regulator n=1 Tax=Allosphingosinicella flava TaxID=2771430 RepID=A0A7T2LLA9_9SPHN|nr:MerR family transcriptional regulator [Sphingosinicella flava]QPQ54311.1 MerR family transcriptional regulator [Sphingosinicella flava]
MADSKSEGAFRTISEVAAELGVPQHILRYWETRFPQLKPLQRAGNRRYYRPDDVALARRIHQLLDQEGYTIRGVQQMLAGKGAGPSAQPVQSAPAPSIAAAPSAPPAMPVEALAALRALLQDALDEG